MDSGRSGRGGCCCEMGGGGGAWKGHHCRDHMGDGKRQFLVVVSGDFRHSLRIPQEVGSHLRNLISESEPVKLEVPNGRIYPVEVRKEFDDVVFLSGWNEFVDAHHLEESDSILFIYRGNSNFKVHMFNSAGHEKSLSCSQPPSGISGAVPPFVPCDHHVLNEQVMPNPGHVTSADFDYTMLPGARLTKAQDEKVLEKARTMRSEIPLYVAAMSKSNVSLKNCYVYIPLRLVDNFKEEITKASVQLEAPDNNIYSVGASKHSDDLIVIESGWFAFVASLRIQENDLLIFRRKGKTRLEILILDPTGREKTSSCSVMGNHSSSAQEMGDDSVQIVDPPPRQVIELSSSDDDSSSTQEMSGDSVHIFYPPPPTRFDLSSSDEDDIVREGTGKPCRAQKRVTRSCARTQKLSSTSSPCTKSGPGARKTHDPASVKTRPYILAQAGTPLPSQAEKKIEEKVQAIQSELPIFVKVMTEGSVVDAGSKSCEMMFCREYASAYLLRKTKGLLLQLAGEETQWEATMKLREHKWRSISRGWREFAGQNGLKVGDICLFQLASRNTTRLKMTVHVIRKSEL